MDAIHYIGFDVHKKSVSFCVKQSDGAVIAEGRLPAEREDLRRWAASQSEPWCGAMEATLFSAWIYDTLKPYALRLEMGHPALMKAIGASKKKSDRLDARRIADLVRCDLLPACYVAPPAVRELRRLLRYRNLVVQQSVRMQNKIAGLLMECGATYNKARLHGSKYFQALLGQIEEVPDSVKQMLRLSRGALDMFQSVQRQLLKRLHEDAGLHARVERLCSIRGIGEVTALTWALEIADPHRFGSISQAVSYCGLTAAFRSSADKQQRGPISKQRNAHLQTVLIEAAKLAPRWNPELAAVHARELERGHRNRATLAVARKLVAYLLAVDKSGKPFLPQLPNNDQDNTALSSPAGMVAFPTPPPVVAQTAERSSRARVRSAAPKPGAPLPAPGRSAQTTLATGGSGGNATLPGRATS
jgi:transposase